MLLVGKDRWNSLYWTPYSYWWAKIVGIRFVGGYGCIGRERSLEIALLDAMLQLIGKDRWNSFC